MDNIKILEEIGLKRVSDETHIEQKYLKYMIDMNYEKLDHINTLGFAKILAREYKIDLDAWIEAFEEYWIENRKDEEDDGLFIVIDDKKSSKKLLIFVLVLFFGVIFGVLFSFFQDKIDIDNYRNNETLSYEQTAIVQEVQQSLDEANKSIKEEDIVEPISSIETLDSNATIDKEEAVTLDGNEKVVIQDKNITKTIVTQEIVENNTTKEVLDDVQSEVKKSKENIEKTSSKFAQEAIIVPKAELWIGLIYLDTKKRRSFLGDGNFSIDISRDQIITTGHGNFDLVIEDEKREFRKQAPIKFLVKDSNITEISMSKFKELNEGKVW